MLTTFRQRFRTLGRDENRLGRISLEFAYDSRASTITVFIGQARNLALPYDNIEGGKDATKTFLHVRVQVLPHRQTQPIVTSLFSVAPPKPNEYRRVSKLHCGSASPQFNEVSLWHDTFAVFRADRFPTFPSLFTCLLIAAVPAPYLGNLLFRRLISSSKSWSPRVWASFAFTLQSSPRCPSRLMVSSE
jgi:hypothetical protein